MPGFPVLEKKSADPGANVEITFTADENMVVRGLHVTLVTDATVAARRVEIVADDGTSDIFFRAMAAADQAASLTHNYAGVPGVSSATQLTTQVLGLPANGIFLPQGGRIRTITANRQAGDNFGAMVLEVERI